MDHLAELIDDEECACTGIIRQLWVDEEQKTVRAPKDLKKMAKALKAKEIPGKQCKLYPFEV